MMEIVFNEKADGKPDIKDSVHSFLESVSTLEAKHDMPMIVFQDGASGAYYIKCGLLASDAASLCDLDAKLDVTSSESYRANRQLLLTHHTFQRMESDAKKGREFNDIVVEYNTGYNATMPLKVWGGQHRIKAISSVHKENNRYHGFRVYFNLSKDQRTEVALISNTNIAVSNDTFDRLIEETMFGDVLRKWCQDVGLLGQNEDFPDASSRAEKITVKKARSFVINFYHGRQLGRTLKTDELDRQVYDPYLAETGSKPAAGTAGITIDAAYCDVMKQNAILSDKELLAAGKQFLNLHNAQHKAVTDSKTPVKNRKSYRNKALVESVLCGWSYVAGLLQSHPDRLRNHYQVPKTSKKIPDPLNAGEMSKYKHDKDEATYRGLGTRSAAKDRQRVAQLFLAKSLSPDVIIDHRFMDKAVSQVVGLLSLSEGYA